MSESVSVTVAAVVERDGRFLLVEEETGDGVRINQPAGHLEAGESLKQAAVREVMEETAYRFEPEQLVGVYRWRHPSGAATYVRFAFTGPADGPEAGRELDRGILRALWLTAEELRACVARHRSPLVWRCVEDYLRRRRYPLELLVDLPGDGPLK
jgi:8-oxo-dGTP pyrophosphatase MutT (NUDIX family)